MVENDIPILKLILEHPKFVAVRLKCLKRVCRISLLSGQESNPGSWEESPFLCACSMGLTQAIQMMVKSKDFDVNLVVRTSIKAMIRSNHSKDKDQVNGFILACESGNLDLVEFLADMEGMDVNHHSTDQYRISPLVAASAYGRVEIVQYLEQDERFDTDSSIALGNPLSQHQHAFEMACKNGHKSVVAHFLSSDRVNFTRTVCVRVCGFANDCRMILSLTPSNILPS